jgi:hypothetical protein
MKLHTEPHALIAAIVSLLVLCAGAMRAESQNSSTTNSAKRFASADDAITSLRAAAQAADRAAVEQIFGPDIKTFLTGDAVQDQANFRGFSQAMSNGCAAVADGADRMILTIGTNDWPFPIPLVKQGGQWFFDTDAGREEVINRHIGADELYAIGVCRAYVKAQKEYYSQDHDGSGIKKYALRFKSTAGHQDGLYWPSTNEPSPFGMLEAEAYAEGYNAHAVGTGPHPFHGYLFRILTSQGRAAPGGKMDYLVNGNLASGFGLVAYPQKYGKSGIMTFIVNQDGKVYQRDFGDDTTATIAKLTQYNPGRHWTLVQDQGVTEPRNE